MVPESRSKATRPINLGAKQTGKPTAGNPHGGFDAAGTGNGLTVRIVRHWSSRQGCKSGKVKVLFPSITCIGRIAYPERAEVTKHDMPGGKTLGCPAGKLAAVGAIWERSKLRGLNIKKCLQPRKLTRGKVAFADQNGKPTHSVLGKADDIEEETGTSTRWDRRGRGPGIWGKICRDRVGKMPLAAGAGSNLQRLSERGE